MSSYEERFRLDLMVERPNSSGSPPMWRPSSYPEAMLGRGHDEMTAAELAAVTARIREKAGDATFESSYRVRAAA